MLKWIETTGKTENDAINAALRQLGLDRDSVSVEVIARAKTGFLGIGSQPARIKVTYEVPDAPAPAPVVEVKPAPAPVAERKVAPTPVVKKVEEKPAPAPVVVKEETAEKAEPVEKPAKADKPTAPKAKKSRPRRKKPVKPAVEPSAPVKAVEVGTTPTEEKNAPTEPVEDRTEQVAAFLSGLMQRLEVEATPEITIAEENIYQVDLVGENLGGLIGRRGETLDAIQQLTNYAVNNGKSQRIRVHIDAEHYRAKREESLQRLARKTAGKALKYRRNMMLEPMNAYERHVIHAALQEFDPCISTYSTGTEPNRRIIVAYNRAK